MATKTAMAKAEKPAASRELTKAQWKWKEAKQNWVAYVMVAPYMIIFAMFTIVPVFLSIFMSFTDFNMLEMPNMVWMKELRHPVLRRRHLPHRNQEYLYLRCHRGTLVLPDVLPGRVVHQ